MDDPAEGFVEGVRQCFRDLPDPRVVNRCQHQLLDILAVAILAVFNGADDWTDMEVFAEARENWLRHFLELPGGIPSHDTFRRVFSLFERKQFATCLLRWTQALSEATGGKLIAIDGKTLRRSHRKRADLAALHLVTAWSSENGLTLAQVAVEDKSNEITAIPEVLKLLNLKGCTVTIDAMECQKEIVEEIRNAKAYYVLAVKDNPPHLHEDLMEHFERVLEADETPSAQHQETHDVGHGRKEGRFYYSNCKSATAITASTTF